MQPDELKTLIENSIENSQAEVSFDGNHAMVSVVSDTFEGLTPVRKQQLVYACLQDSIASGAIHAVHIKTYTRSQWAAKSL